MSTALAPPAERPSTLPPGVPELTLGYQAAAWAEGKLPEFSGLIQPNGPKARQPFRFTPGQIRFLLWWYAIDEAGQWLFNHGVRRLSKGPIAHDVQVMTPGGWRRHGNLSAGDEVYAVDGSITTVTAVKPDVLEDCYRVTFRDGSSIVCTGGHRWPMEEFRGSGRVRRDVSVAEMLSAGITYERPLTKGKRKASKGGVARWCSLPTSAVEGRFADFPLPPYILGYWLGDGDKDCPRITIHRDDIASFVEQCKRVGIEVGEPRPTHGETYRLRFGRGWAVHALRRTGLLFNKHIPPALLRGSLEQRWELLRGLVDSDGTVAPNGVVEISVTDLRLAADIFELAVSLGLMPTRTDSDARWNGRKTGTRARIRFTPASGEVVSRLPRKFQRTQRERSHNRMYSRSRTVVAIEPVESVPANCITVAHPSHEYLVGERNVPTCNSGKSPFAAALALTEFCGPVRLEDFDPKWPGGCVGKPVDMPLVQIAATAESQTANTMRMVRAFAPKSSSLALTYQLDIGKTKFYKLPEGTLEVITSSPTAAEGGEGSLVIADETEHWKPANGGVELASTLEDNLAKSGSRMLETSNAWIPGLETVAEDSWNAWLAQEEGRTRGEQRILYDAVIAAPDTDLTDRNSLTAALEFVYADCEWVNVAAIRERIWSPKARPDESKRKYLNWPTVAEDAWVTPQQWSNCLHPEIKAALLRKERPPKIVEDGAEVGLFFDGSKSRDATALIGVDIDSGHIFTLGVWEPDPNDDADTVDAADVDRVVIDTFDRYDVLGFLGDVKEWESYTLTEWPQRYKDDLLIWAVPQGKPPQPIAWDMRSHSVEFAKAAEACEAEIVEGEFTHDGNAAVARHVGNARRRPHKAWVSIGKESKDSPLKIDAAVCVIGARMVRRLVLGSGKRRKKKTGEAMFT